MYHSHHHRFTHLLNQTSDRLEDLLLNARRFEPRLIQLVILDEIAIKIGELTLILSDHLSLSSTHKHSLTR